VHVGPQGGAVQVVENAVAVGADHGEIAGGASKRRLQRPALVVGLREARSVADGAPGALRREGLHEADVGLPGNGDEARVRRLREIPDVAVATTPGERPAPGVHRPDVAGEADAFRLADHLLGEAPAEDGDVPGAQEAREARV
jgi:hypothetical protein